MLCGAIAIILEASHKTTATFTRIMAEKAKVYSTAPPLIIMLKVSRKTWRQIKRHSLEGNRQ